ncbi:MAG: hypothetical protein ACLFM0_10705 [Spirochaetales bacterium]
MGNPRAANAEKGREYTSAVIGKIAEFLSELVNTDADDMFS